MVQERSKWISLCFIREWLVCVGHLFLMKNVSSLHSVFVFCIPHLKILIGGFSNSFFFHLPILPHVHAFFH